MGFEYKITVSLSESDKTEIEHIYKNIDSKKSDFSPEIEIEDDGIYVCKYDKPDLWLGLDDLYDFLIEKKLDFKTDEL
jgi:hypothetical protein